MEFIPLWTDILEGPCWKIMDLPADQYRFWTFCLMSAQRHDYIDGHLPEERTLAHWCQMDRDECVTLRDKLVTCGLVDCDGVEYKVHDWDEWRVVKDRGAKGRKRLQREREKGLKESVTGESRDGHGESQNVTPQHTPLNSQLSSLNTPPTPSEGERACDPLEPFQAPIEPPQACWTSEQRRVLDKASKWWGASNGAEIVGGLLDTYPAGMVDQAIDSHHGKIGRSIHRGRLEGLCRTIWDGGAWKPSERKSQGGEVPYVPGIPTPNYVAPRVYDPGPPIPADEAYRIMRDAAKGAAS